MNMTVITKLKVPLQNVEGPFTVNTRSPAVLIPRGSMLEIRNLIYKRGPYTCAERVQPYAGSCFTKRTRYERYEVTLRGFKGFPHVWTATVVCCEHLY